MKEKLNELFIKLFSINIIRGNLENYSIFSSTINLLPLEIVYLFKSISKEFNIDLFTMDISHKTSFIDIVNEIERRCNKWKNLEEH